MLRLMTSTDRVFLGWGVFDVVYVARYALLSLMAGRIPYYDDVKNGMGLLADHGTDARILAVVTWGLELSIVLTAVFFLLRWRVARWLAFCQVPFRLVFLIPSVSILFMGPDLMGRYGIGLLLFLLILSECLKVWTLWATRSYPPSAL